MPPVLSLGGTRRGQALLASSSRTGPAAGASARPGRGWRPASPDGWRPWSSAWASVCSSRPIRFGFILAPSSSRPVCPPATAESDAELPEGPPGIARALAARLGQVRALPSWQAPIGGQWVSAAPVALGSGGTRRGPELFTRGRAERHRSGPVPSRPVIPGPTHLPWEGRSTARALNPEWANAASDRYVEVTTSLAAPLVTTGSHPARGHRSVGRSSAAARPVGRPPQL